MTGSGTHRGCTQYHFALLALVLVFVCLAPPAARSSTFTLFDSFGATNLAGIGAHPGPLVRGPDGNFYGTTPHGGTNGGLGTIFKIAPDGTLSPIYNFGHGSDGSEPMGGLAPGSNGNFYGVTVVGGTNGWGSIFSVTPSGVLTSLYSFTALNTNNNENSDGANPYSGLAQGADGNFYGTTYYGGANGQGTIFKVTPSGILTSLYSFTRLDSTFKNSDGAFPRALSQGSDGNLYGTAQYGGVSGVGTVFRITPAGVFSTLHSFTGQSDGSYPSAALTAGAGASFYGTTYSGGTNGGGTIFMITAGGALSNLWSFSGSDGQAPMSALARGGDGNFYGATTGGGTNGAGGGGTIFSITNGEGLQVLYSLASTNSAGVNVDGSYAEGLVQAANGNFYGTCNSGGLNDGGTAFRFSFQNAPFITQQPASQTNSLGAAATFSVGASGGGLGYQWFKNNQALNDSGNVSGSASSLLTLASVSSNDAASYSVLVANSIGSVTSAAVTLQVVSTPIFLTQPASVNTVGGNNVTLSATAVGPGPLTYQWQLNSASLSDTRQVTGTGGNTLTLANVSEANVGSYTVIVANSFGSITSAVAVVNVGVAPSIAKKGQPVSQLNKPVLSQTGFSVTATGTSPLTYQWQRNGVILSDGGDVSGSTTGNLTINSVTVADGGTYSVVVANAFGSLASAAAVLGVSAPMPTVTITSPAANARTTVGTITGTASDEVQVLYVAYYVSNRTTGTAMTNYAGLGSGTTSRTWFTTNALTPGSNSLQVVSFNSSSNYSILAGENFFYAASGPFAVTVAGTGGGTISGAALTRGDSPPGTNSNSLIIGDSYTLTAKPDSDSIFVNWTGNTIAPASTPTLSFVMASNVTLQANFVPNFYLAANGTYNGLFFTTNHVMSQAAGMLANLVVGNQGAYSATLRFGGVSYAFTGAFDGGGYSAKTVHVSGKLGASVSLQMNLQVNATPPIVTGIVSGTNNGLAWSADLTAVRAVNTSNSAAYTMLFSPGVYAGALGYGYGLITNHNGVLTINGALADSTTFNQTVPVSATGDVPFFANPTAAGVIGVVFGWLNVSGGAPVASSVTWIRPGIALGDIAVQGSPWTNPAPNTPAIPVSNGQLIVSNAVSGLDFPVSVNNNNAIFKTANGVPNSLAGTINAKTGLLTVTFGTGIGAATITGYGAVLQNQTSGAGFFVTRTNYGTLLLQPGSAAGQNTNIRN